MNEEFVGALKELIKEKGISEELLFTTIQDAMVAAYKKNYANANTNAQNVKVNMDRETGEIHVYAQKTVVDEVYDDVTEISLEDAKELSPRNEVDDIINIEVTPKNFGRVAAQLAKQVVTQRIKEAERNIIYDEYKEKEFDIITGIILRKDKGIVFVNLGKLEGIIGPNEQIPNEEYNFNERLKLYIVEVKNGTKGPQIHVSRTHPGLVKRLFELEVPEIFEGVVEIKNISREAGSRSKIAVYSNNEEVDPMGACVGPKGARVQSIVNELKNEKIDIIKWSKKPEEFIANSLSPAKVLEVVVNEDNKTCKVVVDDNQLSLAIGKEGQNVRLAAKLTNWKIDIKNKTQKDAQDAEEERILNTEVEIENENTTDLSELEISDDIEVDDSNEDASIEKIEE
ncbi:transcription termination/antitermination protein NusA [Clostridium gelidum]|uniref:Transcription termination/antitermination protein NusA n=1 Tax=Clostridium gelidum TaxID=704125 RepID=A0ABN6J5I4_9CLOT|nr:transcription termination factor NusA [Clostridium gelidum]BCZ48032.1 transcription termination/antitermination protein NusA [Clostridium gelidum]